MYREVGDHNTPAELYEWTAAELIPAVEDEEIGAYHVSLWVLLKFGQDNLARFPQDAIRTGTVGGYLVTNCP